MTKKLYRVVILLPFVIDATSMESATEIANTQAMEWLQALDSVEPDEITVTEE